MLIVLFTMGCAVFFAFGFYHRENLVDKKPSVAKIRRSLGQSKVAFETSRTKKTHPNKTKPKSTEPSQRPKSQVQKSQERNQKLKPQEDDAFGQPKLTRSPTPRTSTQQDSPPRSKSPGTNLTRRKRRVAPPQKPNARPRPARPNPVRSRPVRTVVGYQIRTTPTNCQVWIDGKNQGNTPFRLKVLKGNTVTIVIKRKGFVTKKLTLRGDKSAQIKIQMIEDLF